jgi:YVTN family beta-propeller protein
VTFLGWFYAFDMTDYRPLTSFRVAAPWFDALPPGLAASPDSSRIYLTRPAEVDLFHGKGTLLCIDSATNQPLPGVDVGADPHQVVVSLDGHRVYVANTGSQTVSVVDADTLRLVSTVTVSGNPVGLAVSPDGAILYVSLQGGSVALASQNRDMIAAIDTERLQVTNTLPVDRYPIQVVLSPDGKRLYVTHFQGTVTVMDTAPLQVVRALPGPGTSPTGAALSPDGKRLYIGDFSAHGFVSILDTESFTFRQMARLSPPGPYVGAPIDVAVSPDGTHLFVCLLNIGLVQVVDIATEQVVATLHTHPE